MVENVAVVPTAVEAEPVSPAVVPEPDEQQTQNQDQGEPQGQDQGRPTDTPEQLESRRLAVAYRWARLGYWLVPSAAALLVAAPLAALAWLTLAGRQVTALDCALLLVGLVPAMLLIKAGLVRFAPPAGLPVAASDAPELMSLVEQLRTYLGAPAIDAVFVNDSFTARCLQRPKRGVFGGVANEIVIGLPLLQAVSKAEAAVLIAQELAHMASRNGKEAAEVHRARVTWQQMLGRQASQPAYLRLPFALVTGAYARKFLTLSQSTERAAVFAADRLAAEIAGLANTGSALQRLGIAEAFVADYWARVAQEPVLTPEPTLKPHREMADFLPRMTEWENASSVLTAALAKPADAEPAHPTLQERLAALAVEPQLPAPVTRSAAKLLGPALAKVVDHYDAAWAEAAAPAWRAAYAKLPAETRRLLDLDTLAARQTLDLSPAIERAKLAYFAGGLEEARARYADLLEWHPDNFHAALAAGIAMIDGGEMDGIECLRHALALAPRTDWTKAHAQDWFAVGQALLTARQDFGIDCLEQAIRIDPPRTDMAAFLVDRYFDQPGEAADAA